jgi:hypothetical protein
MKLVFIFVILSISLSVLGGEMDYQKIKRLYPNADYVVFDKNVTITYSVDTQTGRLNAHALHNITLLSLTDDCEELKNIQIPFTEFEEVNVLSAKFLTLTDNNEYNLAENVKVKFLKSKDYYVSGIFYADLKVKEINATVPIREKMVLKYSYEYVYRDTRFLTTIPIQENKENVLNYSLTINIPDYVNAQLHNFNISNPKDILEKSENGLKTISFKCQKIEERKSHHLSPPDNYFLPSFVLTTKNYTYNGKTFKILESTNDLYSWYAGLIKQLNPDKMVIKKLAAEITTGKSTPAEKIEAIFKWVQNNIHYVAFEDGIAGFKPEEAQKVITSKYGDCKGMANALVELLKAVDISAFHTWIGTRHKNYPISTNSLAAHNHMICTVILNNEAYFLDATDNGALWDAVPSHLQGKEALIGKDSDFEVKTVPVVPISNNLFNINFNCSFTNDYRNIDTKLTINIEGIEALDFYNSYYQTDIQTREKLTTQFPRIFTTSFEPDSNALFNNLNLSKQKIESKNNGKIIGSTVSDGKKLYLFINQYSFLDHLSVRNIETPIWFNNKKKILVTYIINIPNQLKMSILPIGKTFKTIDNAISCSSNYVIKENKLIVTREIIIDTLLLDWRNNGEWRKIIEQIQQEENTPVVFNLAI